MTMQRVIKSFNLFFFIIGFVFQSGYAQTAKDILMKMLFACDNVKTAKYTVKKQERLKSNQMYEGECIAKLQSKPFKIYIYNVKPNPGAEVLYIDDGTSGNVLVNPNQFPFINLNLRPFNPILRNNQHHTIFHSGFGYIASILKKHIKNNEQFFYQTLSYNGEVEWGGKLFYKLVIDNTAFAYISYIVQQGEDITSIATKMGVVDYMILCINPELNDYQDVKVGQKIKIPNSYARKIVFYVDKQTHLPLVQIIYDEKGLFEKYEHYSFILNPVIKPEEFTPGYKEYKFK